jgi:hypothetical protein
MRSCFLGRSTHKYSKKNYFVGGSPFGGKAKRKKNGGERGLAGVTKLGANKGSGKLSRG